MNSDKVATHASLVEIEKTGENVAVKNRTAHEMKGYKNH